MEPWHRLAILWAVCVAILMIAYASDEMDRD